MAGAAGRSFNKFNAVWNKLPFGKLPLYLLPLLCVLLYLPALHHDFVMDDTMLVVANPYITGWKYIPQMLTRDAWNVWDRQNYWRPVFSISLALDYSLWGLSPIGFHLTNILLHAISTVLLYLLAEGLQNKTCALFSSLLFALHPIQAHAVNMVATRADLLAALFCLLSLQAFLSRRTISFCIALTLALLSKETSMVMPLAAVSAWAIVQRDKPDSKLILAFAILGLYVLVRLFLGFSFSLIPLVFSSPAPWDIRLLLAFKALALYLIALLNPFESPHPFWSVEAPVAVWDLYVLSGISIFGLLLAAIWIGFKRAPIAAFGLVWFLIFFLPVSNLKEINQSMAEHWLYIPMIGLSLAFGATFHAPFMRIPGFRLFRVSIQAGVAVYLIFSALVVREKTKIYQNDQSFLLAAIRANPKIARLYSMLASTYLANQDGLRAKEFYAKALSIDPDDFLANYRMGFLLRQEGRKEEAKVFLEKVVRVRPLPLYEILTVAHAWEMLGNREKALFYYRKALEVNPQSAWIKQEIANLESQLRGSRKRALSSP